MPVQKAMRRAFIQDKRVSIFPQSCSIITPCFAAPVSSTRSRSAWSFSLFSVLSSKSNPHPLPFRHNNRAGSIRPSLPSYIEKPPFRAALVPNSQTFGNLYSDTCGVAPPFTSKVIVLVFGAGLLITSLHKACCLVTCTPANNSS